MLYTLRTTPQMLQKFNVGMYSITETGLAGEAGSASAKICSAILPIYLSLLCVMYMILVFHHQNDSK